MRRKIRLLLRLAAAALTVLAAVAVALRLPSATWITALSVATLLLLVSSVPRRVAQRLRGTLRRRLPKPGSDTNAAAPRSSNPVFTLATPGMNGALNLSFTVREPLSPKSAIFVARFVDQTGANTRPRNCSWDWSAAVNGYYQYAPGCEMGAPIPLPELAYEGHSGSVEISTRHWPLWDNEPPSKVDLLIHTSSTPGSRLYPPLLVGRAVARSDD